jgi:hypothetical protein
MLKRIAKALIRKLGYQVIRTPPAGGREDRLPTMGFDMEEEVQSNIQRIVSHTMVPYARLAVLYQQAVYCEQMGIGGCYVECGTWKGGAMGLMALANLNHGARRHLHLFDSFEGVPEPIAEKDGADAVAWARNHGSGGDGRLVAIQGTYDGVGTLDVNRTLLETTIGYDPKYLHYHKGWFQETLPKDADKIGPIAILRLDGDWYESTQICLRHLYNKVVDDGFVIIDDYRCVEGCERAVKEFFDERKIRPFLHHLDGDGRYWIKGTEREMLADL